MPSHFKKILHSVLLVALIVVAIRYVDFRVIKKISPLSVLLVWLAVLAANIARFYVLRLAMLPHGIRLSINEWLGLGVYSALINLLLPLRAGLSIKAVYLKKQHQFRYADLVGIQGAIILLQFYVLLLLGAMLGLVLQLVDRGIAIALVFVIVVAGSIPFVLTAADFSPQRKITQALQNAFNAFLVLAHNGAFMLRILLNMLLILLFTGLALYFAFAGLGLKASLTDSLLIGVVVSLLSVVNLTPGNLGIHEFAVAFLSQTLGGDFDTGFVAMLVIRVASVLGFLLLSPIGFRLKPKGRDTPTSTF